VDRSRKLLNMKLLKKGVDTRRFAANLKSESVNNERKTDMRKLALIAIVSFVCVGLMSSCTCPKGKSASCTAKCPAMAQAGKSIDQCPVMSKLNLTAEQKPKVQAICDQCAKDGCSKKACKKMTKELEKVLTPEQMTQYKAACDEMKAKSGCCMKSKKGECPMKKSDEPAKQSK